jgi:AcrR family transcriptional regulator
MPYSAEHKARTRARIIESARILFNRRGFEQVSIDDLMKEAGLTRGGFYHHFRSKDELYSEAVRSFTTCGPLTRHLATLGRKPEPRELARLLVKLYLCDETLRNIDIQCPLVALPSDVARAGRRPRGAYTQLVRGMLGVLRGAFDPDDPAAEEKAQLVVSLCVGGMVLSRTTDDVELRASLRAAARAQALALLEVEGPPRRPRRARKADR